MPLLNPHKMRKDELIQFFVEKCIHHHRYSEHPSCYIKEKEVDLKVGYLDIECVLPNTLILTKQGLKKIQNIKGGEEVLTHKNRWQKVESVFEKEIDENIIEIGDSQIPILSTTVNHPFYTIKINLTKKGSFSQWRGYNLNSIDDGEWIRADKLTKNHLTLGIKNEECWKDISEIEIGEKPIADKHNTSDIKNKLIIDNTFLKVIGLFLGDGYAGEGIVNFFPNIKDKEFIETIKKWAKNIGANNLKITKESDSMFNMSICSMRLGKFFKQFYNENKEKYLPLIWLNLPIERFYLIIEGLKLADGYFGKNKNCRLLNTSEELIKSIYIRLSLSKYYHLSVCGFKKKIINIQNRIYETKPIYELSLRFPQKRKHVNQTSFLDYIIRRIKYYKIKKYKGKIYNLRIENDGSYIANGYITHNTNGLFANFHIVGCYCIKEHGNDKIYGRHITPEELKSNDFDKHLIEDCIEDMLKFDRIITFYGSRFDAPFLRTRSLIHNIKEFPLYGIIKHTDVYFMARNRLRMHRKSLEEVARILGIKGKSHVNGLIWLKAFLHGDKKALEEVYEHCKMDVRVLEKVYERLKIYCLENRRSL